MKLNAYYKNYSSNLKREEKKNSKEGEYPRVNWSRKKVACELVYQLCLRIFAVAPKPQLAQTDFFKL
ncbi:MAG: hypothetical protein ACTSV6_06645 [Candidatus Heimdallarchaeota archaeon]